MSFHLPTLRARRRLAQALDHEPTPRQAAIEWLAAKLADGDLALDPYDETVAIISLRGHEEMWARMVVELTGLRLDVGGAGEIRCLLEPDVRDRLALDRPGAPVHSSAPLASRAVSLVDPVPESAAALRRAKAAYDRKQVRP